MDTCTGRVAASSCSRPGGDHCTPTWPVPFGPTSRRRTDVLELEGDELQIQPKQPTTKGPADLFTGDVWFDVIARGEGESRLRVNSVRFSPCARTAWHSHSLGQTLHVTEGIGIVATREQIVVMRPGDTVHTPPG